MYARTHSVGIVGQRLVKRQLPAPKALLHFDDVALADIEPIRQKLGVRRESLSLQLRLLLFEIVKQLALILCGPHFDQTEGVQQIAQDVRANPPGRVGIEPHVSGRVEFLNGI